MFHISEFQLNWRQVPEKPRRSLSFVDQCSPLLFQNSTRATPGFALPSRIANKFDMVECEPKSSAFEILQSLLGLHKVSDYNQQDYFGCLDNSSMQDHIDWVALIFWVAQSQSIFCNWHIDLHKAFKNLCVDLMVDQVDHKYSGGPIYLIIRLVGKNRDKKKLIFFKKKLWKFKVVLTATWISYKNFRMR